MFTAKSITRQSLFLSNAYTYTYTSTTQPPGNLIGSTQTLRVPSVCHVHMNQYVSPAKVFRCVQENTSAQPTAAYPAVWIRDCRPEAREQIFGVATLIRREGQRDGSIAVRYETHLSGLCVPTASDKMSAAGMHIRLLRVTFTSRTHICVFVMQH